MNEATTDGAGHRQRLRERLLVGGPDALLDHELVESLLGLSIARMDTKPIAKRIIKEFGSIGGLLSADAQTIAKVTGLGERSVFSLKLVHAAALRMISEPVRQQPILSSWQALLDYLRIDLAHITVERVRVLHLNSQNMLIRDDLMSEGSVDQAAVYVREVIARALNLGTAAIILVHNHPSGDPSPSKADIQLTREIADAGRKLGITVHDHIIIGADGHSSMRAMGLI